MFDEARIELVRVGKITENIRKNFFSGMELHDIRNKLEDMGLDRHMSIDLHSTEIAILTPYGLLMRVRTSDNKLGLWGGVLKDDEQPYEGALRELAEETRLPIKDSQLHFVEVNEYDYEYDNGDKAHFRSYRYIVRLEYLPEIVFDEESTGVGLIKIPDDPAILNHQQDFIKSILAEI